MEIKLKLPEAIVYIATSLDGFIATKDHGLAWLDMVKVEGEDYGYEKFMSSIDALVIGRKTYDLVGGFDAWPFEGKKVVVLTHRPIKPIRDESTASGPLLPIFEKLGIEGVKRVYLDGGQAIRTGLKEGIVKEITISMIPILLGSGIPLFSSIGIQIPLKVVGAKQFPSGLVQLNYQVHQ